MDIIKRNIATILTLTFSVILLVIVAIAWNVAQQQALVNGILVNTGSTNYESTLYIYNNENDQWEIPGDKIEFNNIVPNNVFYFALKIYDTSDSMKLNMRFDNISSFLQSNIYEITEEGLNLNNEVIYKYEENTKNVMVGDKFLYKVDSDRIVLQDYLIEDVFKVYICETTVSNEFALESYIPIIGESTPNVTLKEKILDGQLINSDEVFHLVFALEFNEDMSLVNGNSNCYQYQSLLIKNIILSADLS